MQTTVSKPSPVAVNLAESRAGMAFEKSREALLEALRAADKDGASEASPPLSRACHHARLALAALDDARTALASEELL